MAKAKKPNKSKKKAAPVAIAPNKRLRKEPTPDNQIRNWRLWRKIEKQDDLAQLTQKFDPEGKGLERATIIRLEIGATRVNADHIKLLAPALDVPPTWLISVNPWDRMDPFAVYADLTDADKQKVLINMREFIIGKKFKPKL
jgi:transcriptional regulator with XRE-family HTH domain